MMHLDQFLERVRQGSPVEFEDTMAVIDACYRFTPTAFSNGIGEGRVENAAGQNSGSCKVFSLARIHGLDRDQTLALFGRYYREDVLGNPEGDDHGNIRSFIRHGWEGIIFDGEALLIKG